ncbi:MAG: hypothetical protein U0133_17615 [Gemmatimonadales bacterium]
MRARLAILAAGLLSAGDRDPATQRCDTVVPVVSQTMPPVFSWTPACAITELTVTLQGSTVWAITVAGHPYGILPPVTYGQAPRGTMATTPADTLYPSGRYGLKLRRLDFTGLLGDVGEATFSPGAPRGTP